MLWPEASLFLLKDEECIRPGPATDLSFLEKLEERVGKHAHFQTYVSRLTSCRVEEDRCVSILLGMGQRSPRVRLCPHHGNSITVSGTAGP